MLIVAMVAGTRLAALIAKRAKASGRGRWASPEPGDVPRRRFRTTAIFDGEDDLGTRAKQIVRDASIVRPAHTAAFTLLP